MPTQQRVSSNMKKVAAKPDAPLARLHSTTPMPTIAQRDFLSASRANGASSDHVHHHESRPQQTQQSILGFESQTGLKPLKHPRQKSGDVRP